MELRTRRELAGLAPTVHGGQGWKLGNVEDYSQNLNPLGPPEWISGAVDGVGDFGHYPDADCVELKKAIAGHHGVMPSQVVMGAGSSEIIRNFPFTFIDRGDRVLVPRPSFAEYSQQILLAGGSIDRIELRPETDFHLQQDEVFSRIQGGGYRAMYICNPNNPTGRVEPRSTVSAIASECERNGTLLFLDETLLELVDGSGDISMIPLLQDHPNLVILRSFTKSFAVPGIRAGYALTSPGIAAELEKVRLPWNIGSFEQGAAMLMVRNMDYVEKAAADLRAESLRMADGLRCHGIDIAPSESFFYFVDIGRFGVPAEEFRRKMLESGFAVRDCTSFGYPSYVRFCVKDRERDDAFVRAMVGALGM